MKVYTQWVVPAEIGINAFLLTISYSLNALIFVPLDFYQQSKIFPYLKENVSLKTLLVLNKTVLVPISIFIGIITIVLSIFSIRYAGFLIAIYSMSVVLYSGNALKGFVNNLGYHKTVSFCMILESGLKIGLFYLFLRIYSPNGVILFISALFSLLIATILISLIAYKLKLFSNPGSIIKLNSKDIFKFVYPISVGAVLNWFQLQGYRMLLVPLGAAEIVGFYATLSNIGTNAVTAPGQVYTQMFLPKLYKTNGKAFGLYFRNALFMVIGIAGMCLLFSNTIVSLLTKQSFVHYSIVILFGVFGDGGNFLIGQFGTYFSIKNKTQTGLFGSLLATLLMGIALGVIMVFNKLTVYTIGIPIVLSQLFIIVYLSIKYKISIKEEKK